MLQVLESWPKVMLFFPTRIRRKTEAFSKILNGLVILCLVLYGLVCLSLVLPLRVGLLSDAT